MISHDRARHAHALRAAGSLLSLLAAGCILPGADKIEDDAQSSSTGGSTSSSAASSTSNATGTGGATTGTGTGGGSTSTGEGAGGGSTGTSTGGSGGAGGTGGAGGSGGDGGAGPGGAGGGGAGGGDPLPLASQHISGGLGHVCATALTDGRPFCWGRNDFGQVGASTDPFTLAWSAMAVDGFDATTVVTSIAVGDRHSCAEVEIAGASTVQCWGYDNEGQTGGDGASQPTTILAAGDVELTGVTEIASGYRFSCALVSDGTVACWGRGADGSLGEVAGANSPIALGVTLGGAAIAIGAGPAAGTACAALENGDLQCWGNGRGVETVVIAASVDAVAVGTVSTTPPAGQELVVYVADGAVFWTRHEGAAWASPVELGDFGGGVMPAARQVVVGQEELCVVGVDESLHCATYAAGAPDPASLASVSGLGTVAEVALGTAGGTFSGPRYAFRCVLRPGGATECEGSNVIGSIGNGAPLYEPTPLAVPGVTDARTMTLGRRSSGAFTGDEANVLAWGASPAYGVDSPPDPVASALGPGVRFLRFTRTTEDDETYRLHDVFAFQFLADGVEVPDTRLTSVLDTFVEGHGHNARDIGLTELGEVVTFSRTGGNSNGQLGNGTFTNVAPGTVHYIDMDELVIEEIIATPSASHTCVRGKDGQINQLWCWGASGSGQVGNLSTDAVAAPAIVIATAAVDACLGPSRTCAVAGPAGTRNVYCWGAADGGGGPASSSIPQIVPGTEDAAGVACGDAFTCAWFDGGAVRCWGHNEYGQLGDGTFVDRAAPAPVPGLTGVTEVFANGYHACAIHGVGGNVSCWGRNDSRQLGAGAPMEYASPVPVVVVP